MRGHYRGSVSAAVKAITLTGPTALPLAAPPLAESVYRCGTKKNIIIDPRSRVRLECLRDWHLIKVTCGGCWRQATVHPTKLRRSLPGATKLLSLEPRFTCRRCRDQTGNTWHILEMSRNV